MMRGFPSSSAVLAGLVGIAMGAAAQPSVLVRAESRVEIRTQRTSEILVVDGALRDDLGAPLGDRPITVWATSESGEPAMRRELRTDGDGEFAMDLPLVTGGYDIRAAFDGDLTHDRVEVERHVDLERADVRLHVSVPDGGRLSVDRPSHAVTVTAESIEGGADLVVELLDELDRVVARDRTGASGSVLFEVPGERLGPPGPGRIKARSEPDARRAEAQTEVPVVRFRRTSVTLAVSHAEARSGDRVRLSGQLADAAGPIAGAAVGIFDGEDHLRTMLTDTDGRFEWTLEIDDRLEGDRSLFARFDSDTPGRTSCESDPVALRVLTPGETSWSWLLAPLVLCGGLLWLIARRAPRRPERGTPPPPEPVAGVQTASRRGLRAERHDLAGWVLDHRDDEPIAAATVRLVSGSGAMDIAVDARGRFESTTVPAGAWRLEVSAHGYLDAAAEVTIPHRGEWSAASVRLESLRHRALMAFRRVAMKLLPSSRLWGIWTNREVVEQAGGAAQEPNDLGRLGQGVDRAYYAEQPPTTDEVAGIERDAQGLGAGLRGPSRPPEGDPGTGPAPS